ncbi:nuclear transport factor 2 family protein [Halarchaeum sp. P4]|uniref:nuclear transport factor 2 family protein n=1 Tax=Halarchaeum sp. P4 TaxID=3421639 RepID=UPI003EC13E7C
MTAEDVAAIERLKHQYCYRIDDGDYAEWAALFTEDGRFVMDDGTTFEGRAELEAFGTDVFDDVYEETAHTVTNAVVDVNGDTATGRWYLALYHETAEGETGVQQATYRDEFEKVDGEWRIADVDLTYGVKP